jgi:hypothetical protein
MQTAYKKFFSKRQEGNEGWIILHEAFCVWEQSLGTFRIAEGRRYDRLHMQHSWSGNTYVQSSIGF